MKIHIIKLLPLYLNSDEFFKLYSISLTDEEYVSSLYNNILNRDPDANRFKYWTGQLSGLHENRNDVLIGFSESQENKTIFSEETSIIV